MAEWETDLLDEQKSAAKHIGSHARMLAGPGTGKTLTLTRRVMYLVQEKMVPPSEILALTFTRAAAAELRGRISSALGSDAELPHVSTLHAFALRQLIRNGEVLDTLPQPLRIADDWEERNIILEDIKLVLDEHVREVRRKFNKLSADWETLAADSLTWEQDYPDANFLGAWREHRRVYGYTLRSELVYQLKRSLQQTERFELESRYSHLLVDEYQDLNRCDLALIQNLRDMGIEVFVAGDDDQSIYGFRYAFPQGIRAFPQEFNPSESLNLGICVRCDREIIRFAKFVADLDPERLEKELEPRDDAEDGEVHILRFGDQFMEADGISKICKHLLDEYSYEPEEILIIMRSDFQGQFSALLREHLEKAGIPVAVDVGGTPLDSDFGRISIAFLRLVVQPQDSLSLRTLLLLRDNGVGVQTISSIFNLARDRNVSFLDMAGEVKNTPSLLSSRGQLVSGEINRIDALTSKYRELFGGEPDTSKRVEFESALSSVFEEFILNEEARIEVIEYLKTIIREGGCKSLNDLLSAIATSNERQEQGVISGSVNIMTMHKAKGLTANAVIVVACEDEYIPGRQEDAQEKDELRLLYVSLTRARHYLAVTYCERRTGRQQHTGRQPATNRGGRQSQRTLTRFLRDGPISPRRGSEYLSQITN